MKCEFWRGKPCVPKSQRGDCPYDTTPTCNIQQSSPRFISKYTVEWKVNIDARSPRHAAQVAAKFMRLKASKVFQVKLTGSHKKCKEIDLGE